MIRFAFVSLFLVVGSRLFAQDTAYAPKNQLIPAPECLGIRGAWQGGQASCAPNYHDLWLNDIRHWRNERRIRIGLDSWRYGEQALTWTQSSFIQPQMMVQDRYFYDPVSGKYTVGRYLDDLEKRYGGIDAVLVWPTYPNMGIDDRNQHDMIRCMPGGIAGVKQMVADFHSRGVRVLFPMMMWDQGTRNPDETWPQAIAGLMKEIDADGINGDTQDGVPLAFSIAAENIAHPLAFQPENSPSDEALAWNVMTWGQYTSQFNFVPGVDRFRWLEPRHMVNISDRWNRTKIDDLQYAFFNGEGWESWENIWGIWNGITPRDGEATRRMASIERGIAPFLSSKDWEPFSPMHLYGVFASKWPLAQQTVWTIVNRNEYDIDSSQMSVPAEAGMRYFDLYHGIELRPEIDGNTAALSFPLEAHGFGAILASRTKPAPVIQELMTKMKGLTTAPLSEYSNAWTSLPQTIVDIPPTQSAAAAPEGMVKVPGGPYIFKVEGIEIEGSDSIGVDVQYPWEDMPRRFHEHRMEIKPFYIDKYEVTNAGYQKFVNATHYHPSNDVNYLRDWNNGVYPAGWANKPVTWVSLEDAREYARWAGKRLPHEWEWQFAAQGKDGRAFPWGDNWSNSTVPKPDEGRALTGPEDVTSHPAGASPYGVMDMVGNVWQWTDEYLDEHTRSAILRGGSYYRPQGSIWYFPQAYRNNQHGKLLMMAPSYDRAGTLGFRCVKDVA